MKERENGICSNIFVAFSLIWLIATIVLACISKAKSNYQGRTIATVINIRRLQVEGDPFLTPVLEFYYNGCRYVVSQNFGTTNCKYKIGDRVNIRFDINNPNKFGIEGNNILKILMIVFAILAVVFFLIGILLAILGVLF